jgi:hypothetical protein
MQNAPDVTLFQKHRQCQAPAAVAQWKGNMDNLRDFLKNDNKKSILRLYPTRP